MQILYLSERAADRWLITALRQIGHVVEAEPADAATAGAAAEEGFDLMLVDLADAGTEGRAGLLRAELPILAIVDAATPAQRSALLRAGADACLVRPLHLIEVESRLMALLRLSDRTRPKPAGGLVFDRGERALVLDGRRAALTPQEFRLVAYLYRRRGEVVPFERLDRHLHGEAAEPRPDQVRALASRLSRKLREQLGRELLRSVRGHGLALDPPTREAD